MTHSLIHSVPNPMLLIASDGVIAQANASALALFGDWIIGRDHGTVLRQPAVAEQIEAVAAGAALATVPMDRADASGSTLYEVRITALEQDEGRAIAVHFTDLTQLGEIEAMRRDFVANVSHELRTPLTALIGFIETLRGPARDDPAAQARFLSIMEDEALRMDRLIADLLSLGRVEAAERHRPSEPVDLAALVTSAIATLTPRAAETGNRLELIHESGCATQVPGDRDQLMQLVLNLAENALKYGGPDKTVTLELSQGTGTGGLKGRVICLKVHDEGPGIASQHLPRLTERFYRVDQHRARDMGGTGLGLAIVKHIVNRHRGRLGITSEPGKGSTFSVHLPQA